MKRRTRRVRYGGRNASVLPAAGLTGILCRSFDGEYFFRIKKGRGFRDYRLVHSDLEVTISTDEEAALYRTGADAVLDHAPETLGLARSRVRPVRV